MKFFVRPYPNFRYCGDLFGQRAYYSSERYWNSVFPQPSKDSIVYGMLGFHADSQSEAHYFCIDTARTPGLLRAFDSVIPGEVIQIYSTINSIQQTLNFLNIQLKFEGVMITTNDYLRYNYFSAE